MAWSCRTCEKTIVGHKPEHCPETQYSWPSDEDESKVRHGVSGCKTIEELAAYWTTRSSEAWDPVLVRVEGPESQDCPWTGSSGRS